MRKLALSLSLLLTLPSPAFARNWQDSTTRADDDCAKLARACSAAAVELAAARKLIEGYEREITAAAERIEIARKEVESLRELSGLEADRAEKLQAVIDAEREKIQALTGKIDMQEKRIASLEGKLKRARKFALVAGVAVVVVILIGVRR
jgi:predicted RNase H-like nuclease (RuvC/YqgF family)